jgi:ceramidase
MNETRAASCMPHSCFCEEIRSDGLRQPANSLSSLAFVLVAAIVILRGWRDERVKASLFALTLAFVGIGSAWYHGSLSFTGQFFDVLGMYLIATLALLLSLSQIRHFTTATMVAAYAAINFLLAAILWVAPVYRRWIFAGLLAGIIATEMRNNAGERRYMLRAIAVMGIAFVIWILDFTRTLCSPSSPIQGHAVWHILGALAAWFLFLHYRDQHVTRIR